MGHWACVRTVLEDPELRPGQVRLGACIRDFHRLHFLQGRFHAGRFAGRLVFYVYAYGHLSSSCSAGKFILHCLLISTC
jgi:hypothetical protein